MPDNPEYQPPSIGRISIIKKHVDRESSDAPVKFSYIQPKVMVAIPCYNEEVAIGSIVLRAKRYADHVVVIDDGSKDKTAEIAKIAGAEVLTHEKNEGKGSSIKDAFTYAEAVGAEVLVLIDGDGQHNPDEIPSLIAPILNDEADMVNGSRFLEKGNSVPKYRRVGQEVLTFATNVGAKKKLTDTQNGFRAFSSSAFKAFGFKQKGMAIESEMVMDAANANLKIAEVPINVRYDVDGSTLNPVRHGFGVLNSVIQLTSQRRPLLFFCVPGAVLLFAGLLMSFYVLDMYAKTVSIPTIYAMMGMLCVIIGTFGIFTGITLASIKSIKSK
ncbi:MAG: glycosyltransferase family 2 protein [Dehalobacter sp.]|nr:glycosyltransferase family 2 protein [Dehalobacter sp.]